MEKLVKLLKWFVYSVALGVLPIFFDFFRIAVSADGSAQNLFEFLSQQRELLIAATAILGESTGDLFTNSARGKNEWYAILGGVSILSIVSNSCVFGYMSTTNQNLNIVAFALTSLILSATCKLTCSTENVPSQQLTQSNAQPNP